MKRLFFAAIVLVALAPRAHAADAKPNIVFILADDK